MIIINTFHEIKVLKNISNSLKDELMKYFQEIAEGIVGDKWQDYKLSEVGSILVVEDADTIDVLDKHGLMRGNTNIPQLLPEFALRVIVDEIEMLKIIWVFGDCDGVSMYYPVGKFGKEFDDFINQFVAD